MLASPLAVDAVSSSDLEASADRITALEDALERARAQHEDLIHRAVHGGSPISEVAEAARVSSASVRSVARRPRIRLRRVA